MLKGCLSGGLASHSVSAIRQVGKTMFLKHLISKNISYVTIDDPLVLRLAKEDPAFFSLLRKMFVNI